MAYFKTGYSIGEFIFKGFDVETPEAFASAFVGLVSSAILFEGIRIVRDFFLNRFTDARKESLAFSLRARGGTARYSRTVRGRGNEVTEETKSLQQGSSSNPQDELEDEDEVSGKQGIIVPKGVHPCSSSSALQQEVELPTEKIRYGDLILSTILHMIYIIIGYILMLAVMTFNVWVLVAVSIGICIGYFLFGTWRRTDHVGHLSCRTLITSADNACHEGSSEKTGSTNSDSVNSVEGKTNNCKHGSGDRAKAHVTAEVDVHCSKPF